MIGSKPPKLRSERLGERLEGLRLETVIVPDWRRIGIRALLIGLLFGVWAFDAFDLILIPDLAADAALALSAFLGGVSYLQLVDRRLWVERQPTATDSSTD